MSHLYWQRGRGGRPGVGVRSQFAFSDGCWRFSNAGWHSVAKGNFEFSVAKSKKRLPIIKQCRAVRRFSVPAE